MSEEKLQQTIVAIFKTFYPNLKLISSLNGISLKGLSVKQKSIIIKDLKLSGMIPGEADCLILLPEGKSLHIELKVGNNTQQPNQVDYQNSIELLGHQYFVVKTIEEFFTIVNRNLPEIYKQIMLQDLQNTFTEEQLIKQYQLGV